MRNFDKLISLAKGNNGYIFTKDVIENNIPRSYLTFACNEGVIEKVSSGIYLLPDHLIDNLFIFQKNNSKVVYAAFTSAYLHNLTTRDTEVIYASVPREYNSKAATNGNVISREPLDLYELGLSKIETLFGNTVVCHNIHRTICDLFSKKFPGDKFVQVEALKNYLERKDKNLIRLMEYATKLNVDKQLRERLEVLT